MPGRNRSRRVRSEELDPHVSSRAIHSGAERAIQPDRDSPQEGPMAPLDDTNYGRKSRAVGGAPKGNRTPVSALRGRRPRPLDDGSARLDGAQISRPRGACPRSRAGGQAGVEPPSRFAAVCTRSAGSGISPTRSVRSLSVDGRRSTSLGVTKRVTLGRTAGKRAAVLGLGFESRFAHSGSGWVARLPMQKR